MWDINGTKKNQINISSLKKNIKLQNTLVTQMQIGTKRDKNYLVISL